MQTGIVRTADGLLLPGFGPLAMFKMLVEAALSSFMAALRIRSTAAHGADAAREMGTAASRGEVQLDNVVTIATVDRLLS